MSRDAFVQGRQVFGDAHPTLTNLSDLLVSILKIRGNLDETADHLGEVLDRYEEAGATERADQASRQLSSILRLLGKTDREIQREAPRFLMLEARETTPWVSYVLRIQTPGMKTSTSSTAPGC